MEGEKGIFVKGKCVFAWKVNVYQKSVSFCVRKVKVYQKSVCLCGRLLCVECEKGMRDVCVCVCVIKSCFCVCVLWEDVRVVCVENGGC